MLTASEFADRIADPMSPTVVIAEAGSNHDGSVIQAKKLIDAAAAAGCDAVKFQLFKTEELVLLGHPATDILRSVEFPRDWLAELVPYCQNSGIAFCASPFDSEAVDMLSDAGVPLIKIASPEIHDLPLIRHAASTGIPLVISTGMATLEDAEIALNAARDAGAVTISMLHCVSLYPTPPEHMHLRMIQDLDRKLGVPVGLSDHSESVSIPAVAVGAGARVIEKHFTLDRNLPGPDHGYAIEPDDLKEMMSRIREAEASMGRSAKAPIDGVEDIALNNKAYVSAVDIPAGVTVTEDLLKVKRVPDGIRPARADLVLGRAPKVDIPADTVIRTEMF